MAIGSDVSRATQLVSRRVDVQYGQCDAPAPAGRLPLNEAAATSLVLLFPITEAEGES